MASCFSTDNTSSPLGLLPGWRKGRNSSATDRKTARFILKFFFHSLSGKIPLNKLSHHCSVLPELLHILPRRLILLRMRRSRATLALYRCVAWAVNCLWRKLCIIKSDRKKPQHWNVAARADNKGKRTLTAKMRRSSAIISVYMPSDHATMSGNVTPGPWGCKFACKCGPFLDHG